MRHAVRATSVRFDFTTSRSTVDRGAPSSDMEST